MKKLYFSLSTLFIVGSAIAAFFLITGDLSQEVTLAEETHADWPNRNIEELSKKADLIAVVKTGNTENKKVKLNDEKTPLDVQLTELKVKKVIKGADTKRVTLNQALEHVEKNEKYLMFLRKGEDGSYYELTNKAILKEKKYSSSKKSTNLESDFVSEIEGLQGTFKVKDISEKVQSYLK